MNGESTGSNGAAEVAHAARAARASQWEVIRLRAIARDDDILGREPGEALCPERYNEEALAQKEADVGPRAFASLYQQDPAPIQGAEFKVEHIKRYRHLPDGKPSLLATSWDCTFKKTGRSWVVGQLWAVIGVNKYLIHQLREKAGIVRTKEMVVELALFCENRFKRKATAHLIEDKANGPAVMDELASTIAGMIAINPRGDKTMRARAQLPAWTAGNVWLPAEPFIDNAEDGFIREMLSFPYAKNDDQVDAMSQFLEWEKTQNLAPVNMRIPFQQFASNNPTSDM